MPIQFNEYPEYKASGIEWLGDIPNHWKYAKLKYVTSCNDETLSESTENDLEINYVEISDVTYEGGITNCSTMKFGDSPSRARRIARKEDVVISTVRTYLRAIAKVNEERIICSTGFAVIRAKELNAKFLYFVLSSPGFLDQVSQYSTGVSYPAITATDLINLLIPIPPLDEQQAIAGYLDEVTGKIDALVEEKEAQVEELRSYRTSLITEAVTRGLNPDVPLRPSGIDWLGDTPAHWKTSKLKYYIEIRNGSDPKSEGEIPVYGSGATSFKTCGEFKEGPTVLIGRKGATLHIPHWIEGRYWNVDTAFDTKVIKDFSLRFFYYLTINFDYGKYKSETTLPSMTQSAYENMLVPVPPITEQAQIAEYLDEKTAKIDGLIAELEAQIKDLTYYKQAVITEAVTGKVDVCDLSPEN